MMESFEDLDLAPALVAATEAAGWDAPGGLQRDAVAVLRRGNNVVLRGSSGSGATGAYGLAVLDRILAADDADDGPEVSPRALVLVADSRTASATAHSLARLALPADLTVAALAPGWTQRSAHVLVASPDTALTAVSSSRLKLGDLLAVVVDGADVLADGGTWSAVETLVESCPPSAQRIVVTGGLDSALRDFLERHVRKAMTVPPQGQGDTQPRAETAVRYAVVTEAAKVDAIAHFVPTLDADSVAVVCRTFSRAEAVAADLAARGLGVEGHAAESGPDLLVLPRSEADQRSIQAGVVSYDVPFDAEELAALHTRGGAVLVTPRERAHLTRIARRAGIALEAVAMPRTRRGEVEQLRERLRALVDEDLAAELALLEPLLDEYPAAEVAAAAMRMARTRGAGTAMASPPKKPAVASGTTSAPPPESDTWVHLFMTVGKRDGVGPGDIVGAITGEANISGDQVGKIDIRESHTTVEVATPVAGRVIEALNGRSLSGRSVRVDYDRKDRGSSRGGGQAGSRS